ncbi:dicarboxylate/amino acid:cation symporter [Corynebacterium tapiri]|uniref:Dicarboxylate/amino acid:cation symporter n=1 Tax=Corynebacterium tapiri TaxID=1448266 RepID=A0A5C4U373_9CORY|nr:dicarboxylate/amino acid:cation symporter [Corynebacterium tapiri]TNL95364.1 dicarboxylate/amino acid:cation symporter [Corynebacterium tapiri]
MAAKKILSSLLARVILAIILGVVCSFIFPEPLARVFATFNGLFGNFLSFFVPVLIFALITPAIAGLGRGAGKWLGMTTALSYGSTIVAGAIAYATARGLYPTLLGSTNTVEQVEDVSAGALTPYFEVEMTPPFEIISALLLAFTLGVAMTAVKSDVLYEAARELEGVIMKVIEKLIVPLLPLFIFGMFLDLGMNGNLKTTMLSFGKVLVLAVVLTLLYLVIQYVITGAIVGRNPFVALKNMLPAYFTALGTSSSAATIPISMRATINNGVRENVAGFTVPLCATIHLSGSMIKIILFAFAIVYMSGLNVSLGLAIGFILMLGITMIAAPGVPGGAIMAAAALLQSMLGFDEGMVALMIAAYIAIDSFGTAANVAGDGAIALLVDKFSGKDEGAQAPADAAEAKGGSSRATTV